VRSVSNKGCGASGYSQTSHPCLWVFFNRKPPTCGEVIRRALPLHCRTVAGPMLVALRKAFFSVVLLVPSGDLTNQGLKTALPRPLKNGFGDTIPTRQCTRMTALTKRKLRGGVGGGLHLLVPSVRKLFQHRLAGGGRWILQREKS